MCTDACSAVADLNRISFNRFGGLCVSLFSQFSDLDNFAFWWTQFRTILSVSRHHHDLQIHSKTISRIGTATWPVEVQIS
jgi:hypothetical protein